MTSKYKEQETALKKTRCSRCEGHGVVGDPKIAWGKIIECPDCKGDGLKVDAFDNFKRSENWTTGKLWGYINEDHAFEIFNAGVQSKC